MQIPPLIPHLVMASPPLKAYAGSASWLIFGLVVGKSVAGLQKLQQHRVFALPAPQTVHGYIDLGIVGCGVIPFHH